MQKLPSEFETENNGVVKSADFNGRHVLLNVLIFNGERYPVEVGEKLSRAATPLHCLLPRMKMGVASETRNGNINSPFQIVGFSNRLSPSLRNLIERFGCRNSVLSGASGKRDSHAHENSCRLLPSIRNFQCSNYRVGISIIYVSIIINLILPDS